MFARKIKVSVRLFEIQNRAADVAQKWYDLVTCITPQKKRGKERKKLKTENEFLKKKKNPTFAIFLLVF